METMNITATRRESAGTKSARRLRKTGALPAILYGHGEPPESLALPERDVLSALHHGAHLLNVKVDGTEQACFIKAVQYDYLGTNPVHLDLTRVRLDELVTVTITVELRGVPKGISDGGVLDQRITDLEIECAVGNIPDGIRLRVNDLGLGESLHVRELELPEGVTAKLAADEVVATVRLLVEEPDEAEEETEEGASSAEPELIRKPKEDDSEKAGK